MNKIEILSLSYGNYVALEDYEKIQQENKSLRQEIKIHSKKSNGRYKAIKILENHIRKLNLECQKYFDLLMNRDEVIDKLIVNWNFLEKYLDENKMVLNNPSIFQFYLIRKEILQKYKGVDD